MPHDDRMEYIYKKLNVLIYRAFYNPSRLSEIIITKAELESYINQIRRELNPTAPIIRLDQAGSCMKDGISHFMPQVMHLRLYRLVIAKALGDPNFESNYFTFFNEQAKNSTLYHKCINQGNPFLLHIHLIKLYNVINSINLMQSGRIAKDSILLDAIPEISKLLAEAYKQIKSLNNSDLGVYKYYLAALAEFCFAIYHFEYTISTPESDISGDELSKSHLIRCYALTLTIKELEADDYWLIDFWTSGRNLYERIGVKSVDEFLELVKGFMILSATDLNTCDLIKKDLISAKMR